MICMYRHRLCDDVYVNWQTGYIRQRIMHYKHVGDRWLGVHSGPLEQKGSGSNTPDELGQPSRFSHFCL